VKLALLALLFLGCKEARTPTGPGGSGPDVTGPSLVIRPGQDTTVDSTGTLNIRVIAADRSRIRELDLFLIGGAFGFPTLTPNDTVADVIYPVALQPYAGGSFQFYARAVDILDHETVSDTVTVTVR
jgi:hypothetical protein